MSNTNTNSNLTINGTFLMYGLTMTVGSGANNATITLVSTVAAMQFFKLCKFRIAGTATSTRISVGSASGAVGSAVRWRDCDARFGNASQGFLIAASFTWEGGSIEAGGTAITTMLNMGATFRTGTVTISGVDLSNLSSTANLIGSTFSGCEARVILRDCKLPASWSGALFASSPSTAGVRAEMYNCDNADTNYRLWVEDYAGSIKHETTIVRTGGASDGTTGLSWKMATSANAEFPVVRLESPEIVIWNDTAGSTITVTVEIVHDSQGAGTGSAFRDDEIWLEVMAITNSSFPLGQWADNGNDYFATPADQTSSSATWTTTGLSSPVKQKLSKTIAPEKGFLHVRVVMAKASKTCYVCPKVTIT
jgi:hypothetical protein